MSQMRPVLLLSATLLAGISLTACETKTEPKEELGKRVYYNCSGNRGFFAAFDAAGGSVALEIGSRRVTLPQIPSASGATYSDGTVSLYTKGEDAFLEEGSARTYSDCTSTESAQ